MNNLPKGGSQEILDVPFDTQAFTRVLDVEDFKTFLEFVNLINERKGEIGPWTTPQRYRLGQFTTNKSRMGILNTGAIPGIRKVATDYAANAYQTLVNEDTLKLLCQTAEDLLASKQVAKEAIQKRVTPKKATKASKTAEPLGGEPSQDPTTAKETDR